MCAMGLQITYGKHDSIKCWYYSDSKTPAVEVPEGVAEYGRLRLKIRARLRKAIEVLEGAETNEEELRAKAQKEAYLDALQDIDETPPHDWFQVGATTERT